VVWTTQPVVKVQDAGGNTVTSSSASITLAIGTKSRRRDADLHCQPQNATSGVDTFAGCKIDKGGTAYTLTANERHLTSASSGSFNITVGALDHFLVEKSGGGPIGTQTAGTPFSLRITAQDVNNSTVTSFTSTATLTSTGTLTGSPVTTAAFTAGVLDPQSVTITNTGLFTITATSGTKSGTSSAFNVGQAPAITSANHTTFTAGAAGTFTVTATGFPAPTFSETGECRAVSP